MTHQARRRRGEKERKKEGAARNSMTDQARVSIWGRRRAGGKVAVFSVTGTAWSLVSSRWCCAPFRLACPSKFAAAVGGPPLFRWEAGCQLKCTVPSRRAISTPMPLMKGPWLRV